MPSEHDVRQGLKAFRQTYFAYMTRHTFIVLAILAIVAAAGYSANVQHGAGAHVNRLALYTTIVIAQAALLRYVLLGWHAPLRELTGGFAWYDPAIAAVLFFAIRYASIFMHRVLGGVDDHTSFLRPQTPVEIAVWIVVAIVAGISEEIVFRGYLQQKLPLGVFAQALIFGISHGYQGVRSVINIAVIGLLFGVVAKWRRSLVPGMIAHAATDLMAIF